MIRTIIRILSPRMEWTNKRQSHFKQLLSRVKVKAEIEDGCVKVRPENVGKFKELCDKEGLGEVREVQKVIKYLQEKPGEWIRFEV